MEPRVRVLLIEDDPDRAMLLSAHIGEACGDAMNYLIESTDALQAGLDMLARQEYDIVLLNLMPPDSRGLEALLDIRAKAPSLPVVVLTGVECREAGLAAVAHGAQDFLSRSGIDTERLRRALGFAYARGRLLQQMENLLVGTPDGKAVADRWVDTILAAPEFKDRLLDAQAHELRTPLSVIKAVVSTLRDQMAGPLTEDQTEMVEIADRNISRLTTLINGAAPLSGG